MSIMEDQEVVDSRLLKDFEDANAQFTGEIYKQLLTEKSGNFAFCPLSVEVILALVHAGACGKTAEQLSIGLRLSENLEEIQRTFKNVTSQLHGNEVYTLQCANKIYLKDCCNIKDEFKDIATGIFNAEIEKIDFAKKEEAASEMNKWVEGKTHKIKNLISVDQIDEFTHTVLINAVYFCGKWKNDFNELCNSKKPFHVDNENTVDIDMMTQETYFEYYDSSELDATFLEMPYQGNDVTMNIVLPKDKDGLSKLESRVSDIFTAPRYDTHEVLVVLPKFETETSIEFKPILQELGIVDAFEDFADFGGIVSNVPTKITSVVQKAFIEVHEEGTTAAAATEVCMAIPESGCAASIVPPPPKVKFIADHPFLFYIKFKDVVLFAGKYALPTT